MKNTVTQAVVDAQIVDVSVSTIFDKVTVVSVRLKNGFVLVESAGAVDKANYSETVGREICISRIKNRIWELEGYRLSSEIAAFQEQPGKAQALAAAASELCYAIEKLPACEQQTAVSIQASTLAQWLRDVVPPTA